MLRKKNSEPAQLPEARQELLEFESPAVQPGKKDPKQFLKHNWKKITAVAQNQQKGRAGQHPVCGSSAGTA